MSGHFPVWSVCEHGPTASLVARLKPVLEYHNVSAYLSGHDHCEEHIDDSNGFGPQYHVIGAANQNGGSHKNKDKVPTDQVIWCDLMCFQSKLTANRSFVFARKWFMVAG